MELMYRTLANGVKIPLLGVCPSTSGDIAGLAQSAVENGYRHLVSDTSGDQDRPIGSLLLRCAETGVLPREEFFITIKAELPEADEEYDELQYKKSLRERLRLLAKDQVEMVVLSKSPYAESLAASTEGKTTLVSCWTFLCTLLKEGKVRCLAVEDMHDDELDIVSKLTPSPLVAMSSNFKTVCSMKPIMAMKRIETGVTLPFNARRWAHNKLGEMLGKSLEEIAKNVNRSLEQIVIRYMLQKRLIVICAVQSVAKTFQVWDFGLSADDLRKMGVLFSGQAIIV